MFKSPSALRWREALARHWPWAAIPVLAIPAVWTFGAGFPASADGFLHLLRSALLDVSIRSGVFYPRWLPQLVLGYGYPVLNFYGPATFYLVELLHLAGLGYYQALMGAFVVMLVTAGYGMYLLASVVLGRAAAPWPAGPRTEDTGPEIASMKTQAIAWAALVAAVAYMYAPYLLTNVFIRGAIGEVGAQALLPFIFWSFHGLMRHPRPGRWVLPAALSLGGLACTHNITLLFLPPALLGYMAVLWWPVAAARHPRRLVWAAAALLAAMGVGAFFWLPVLGERQYLANTAYGVARQYIAVNTWTWQNFLNGSLRYIYSVAVPFQLGLVQLPLAAAGFLLARRRDAEWFYWLALAVLAGLGIGSWALPIWLSSDLLLAAQFPWRLLILVTIPLALCTGGSLTRLRSPRWQAAGGLALVAVIMLANTPHFDRSSILPIDNSVVNLPAVAQFETLTESVGTSSAQEFMPRWVQALILDPATAAPPAAAAPALKLSAAGAYERVLEVSSAVPFTLRLTDFYFPGWRAFVDEAAQVRAAQPLAVYPSTNMGLLTVDVPAGAHRVRVVWQATALEQGATYLTLATLLALTVFQLRQRQRRWLAVLPALLLAYGAVATFKPLAPPVTVEPPAAPYQAAGLQLLGYRLDQPDPAHLYLYPYWQTQTNVGRLEAHWRLTDVGGSLVSEIVIEPNFGGGHTANWPANTLVDDAYQLPLPPGLKAGAYDLSLELLPLDKGGAGGALQRVGVLNVGAVPQAAPPAVDQTLNTQFGQTIMLAGYNLRIEQKPAAAGGRPVVRPGAELEYTLFWRALGPIDTNYHGFVHLLDAHQAALVKQDQLAGTWFHPPVLWDPFYLTPDVYRMQVPSDTPGGLYWPRLGLYHFDTLERLPIQDTAGKAIGSSLDLAPIKVVPPAPRPPQHLTSARFGDLGSLWGYDLSLPPGGLRPGGSFTLTLYYRSAAPSAVDYTHFVHLFAADGRVVAQDDAQPQRGVNPTSAWVPGEVIVDPIVLTVAAGMPAGTYTLRTGLYDPAASGARLAALDANGNPLPDDTVILGQLSLTP